MKFDKINEENAWCPGCGNFSILIALKKALEELNYNSKETVFVSGIGQAAKMPQYVGANYFNGLHGRAIPAARGIKYANSKLKVIVTSGDGDIYGEGGNHLIHAIRNNPNISVFVSNNMVYGLTKGQPSPTAQLGFISKVQPQGNKAEPFNPVAYAVAGDISFVARALYIDIEQTKEIMKKALEHSGFSLVDILQACPSFNKLNNLKWFRRNSYYLENYNPKDRLNAFKTAIDEKFALGVIYCRNGQREN